MPITKSAEKALRQSKKRRAANIKRKDKVKNLLKEVQNLISQKKPEEVKKLLPQIYKVLDKAAKNNLIKKGTADRQKSRIAESINKISS